MLVLQNGVAACASKVTLLAYMACLLLLHISPGVTWWCMGLGIVVSPRWCSHSSACLLT